MTEFNQFPQIPISPRVSINEFFGIKQYSLFHTLKKPQFTGELKLISPRKEQWTFYLYLGRIIYATGGKHSVRRWCRNVNKVAPSLVNQLSSLNNHIFEQTQFRRYWEYELINYLLTQNMITTVQINQIIRGILLEIFFDISQQMEVVFELTENKPLSTQLVFINSDQIILEAAEVWNKWTEAKLADRSPNFSPIILQFQELQKRTSAHSYRMMFDSFNGKKTLRDLSIELNQEISFLTKVILPYIQRGLIDLVAIPDLPCPLKKLRVKS